MVTITLKKNRFYRRLPYEKQEDTKEAIGHNLPYSVVIISGDLETVWKQILTSRTYPLFANGDVFYLYTGL